MQKKVIYLLIFLLSSCNQLKESIGDFNEVVILTSNQDKNFIFSEVSKLFSGCLLYTSPSPRDRG